MSDYCICEEGKYVRVKEYEVMVVYKVNWFGSLEISGDDFFVWYIYIVEY